jgi:Bacterial regulatory helix-turn-helix protein, lysR family
MITLRQLRYLGALAEHRHFGRAAEACSVTQPALSMQIKELEGELGIQLIERRASEVALTDIGSEVARRAELVASTRDLADFARHRGQLLTGGLKFGVIPSIAPMCCRKSFRCSTAVIRTFKSSCARRRRGNCSRNSRAVRSTLSCWRCPPITPRSRAFVCLRIHSCSQFRPPTIVQNASG